MLKKTPGFKGLFLVLVLVCNSYKVRAQLNEGKWALGPVVGLNATKIDQTDRIIMPETYFQNYSLYNTIKHQGQAGIFARYQFHRQFAFYGEFAYAWEGDRLNFNNPGQDINYRLDFNYEFYNMIGEVFYNPIPWVHFGLGPIFGINGQKDQIVYNSGGKNYSTDAFGTDAQMEKQLRSVLHGQNDLGFVLEGGVELKYFDLSFRFISGQRDLVRVDANSYNFVHRYTPHYVYELLLRYDLFGKLKRGDYLRE